MCLSLPRTCRLLGEAGGVESIVQLLQDQESQCRQYAADCVTTMAPDGKHRLYECYETLIR